MGWIAWQLVSSGALYRPPYRSWKKCPHLKRFTGCFRINSSKHTKRQGQTDEARHVIGWHFAQETEV